MFTDDGFRKRVEKQEVAWTPDKIGESTGSKQRRDGAIQGKSRKTNARETKKGPQLRIKKE